MAAGLIDLFFSTIVAFVVGIIIVRLMVRGNQPIKAINYLSELVTLGIYICYFSIELAFGWTPGKKLLGLIVTRADGSKADGWTLLSRWITKFGPWIVYFFALLLLRPALLMFVFGVSSFFVVIGCLAALGESKRTWHDRWSNTAVCRVPRPPPLPQRFRSG